MTALEMRAKATDLLNKLNFDECVQLFEKLPAGNPMIDLVFDRMEEIDAERFDSWL